MVDVSDIENDEDLTESENEDSENGVDYSTKIKEQNTLDELNSLISEYAGKGYLNKQIRLVAALRRAELLLDDFEETEFLNEGMNFTHAVFRGKYATLFEVKNIFVKKFRTKGKDYRMAFNYQLFTDDKLNALSVIYAAFKEILKYVFAETDNSSYGRFLLLSPSFKYPVSVRFQPVENITAEVIFAYLENVLSSNDVFLLNNDLRIHILICDPPAGSGKTKREEDCELQKRSCKKVCFSSNDYLCLSRAIIIGRALIDFPNPTNPQRQKYLKKSQFSKLFEEQKALHIAAEVPIEERLYSLADIEKFQKAIQSKYRIIVFEKVETVHCIYVGKSVQNVNNIYLYLHNEHFECITDINHFLPGKNKFCPNCKVVFGRRAELQHLSCTSICSLCFIKNCQYFSNPTIDTKWVKCQDCFRSLPEISCFQNHKEIGEKKKKACANYL